MHGSADRTARANGRAAGVMLLALLALRAAAQNDDVPRPPRLDADAPPPAATAPAGQTPVTTLLRATNRAWRPLNAARLAPLPQERRDAPEEIIVVGGGEWRLPDLGSGWRDERAQLRESGRYGATFFPLYDPEKPPQRADSLLSNPERQRLGFIELFRVRFGRHPGD